MGDFMLVNIDFSFLFSEKPVAFFKALFLSVIVSVFCWLTMFGPRTEASSIKAGNFFFILSHPLHWSHLIPLVLIISFVVSNYFLIEGKDWYQGHKKIGLIAGICFGCLLAVIISMTFEEFFKLFVIRNDLSTIVVVAICIILAFLSALLSDFPSSFWTNYVFFASFIVAFNLLSVFLTLDMGMWVIRYKISLFLSACGFVTFSSTLWIFSLMLQTYKRRKII